MISRSLITMFVLYVRMEVTVGDPFDGMTIGTLVLFMVKQDPVVKLNIEDQGLVPHEFTARTLQK